MSSPQPAQSVVRSVARSLDLLEALMGSDGVALTEVAKRVGLQPSTAHRLLGTLVDRGYASQDARTGHYGLGYKVLEMASAVHARTTGLRAAAHPHLATIQRITKETTNLVVFDPPSVVYVDQVEGTRSMRMFTQVGRTVAPYTSAAGKAILAFQADALVDEICGPEPFVQLTPRTITSMADLRADLARIVRRGYAVENEEHEEGVSCIGAPIFDRDGSVRAAISVSAPTPRVRGGDAADLGELLAARAADISSALGFKGTYPGTQ